MAARVVAAMVARLDPRAGVLIAALLAPCAAAALDASALHLRQTSWTQRDGAQANGGPMAQTTDGYLWLGTANGLFRFDALHFEEIDLPDHPELRAAEVYSLLPTRDGGLWIGYTLGGIAFLKDDRATLYTEKDGLSAGTVYRMGQESDGTLWATTSRGLSRFRQGHWTTLPTDPRLGHLAHQLIVDGDDSVWIYSTNGVFVRRKGHDSFDPVPGWTKEGGLIALSPSGTVWGWLGSSIERLAQARPLRFPAPRTELYMRFDDLGSAWLFDERGNRAIYRISAADFAGADRSLSTRGRPPVDLGRDVVGFAQALVDDEGNVWISNEVGLVRLSASSLQSLKSDPLGPPGITYGQFPIAAGDGGALWIAQTDPPLSKSKAGSFLYRQQKFESNLDIREVSCAVRAEGAVWFGGSRALWKESAGQLTRFDLPPDMNRAAIQSMAGDGHGGLWVSIVRKGIYRFVDGVWTPYPQMKFALVVATDPDGRLWLGNADGQVAMFDGTNLTRYTKAEGLDIGAITAFDVHRGRVWVGGNAGMARLDGKVFRTLNFETGSTPRNVKGIIERGDGELWLMSAGGIAHVAAAELSAATADPSHAISAKVIGAADGVEGNVRVRPTPAFIEGTDGRIWATTTSDIYSIDPAHLVPDPRPPRLTLRGLSADGRPYRADQEIALPPRVSNIRIGYSGLSLTAAERIRYRYRLDGFDQGWQEAESRREAFFTNLPPGDYRFRVQARFVGNAWGSDERALAFTIAPAFVQTRGFLVLCIIAVVALVWALAGWRIWQVRHRLHQLFEARVAERERIARDLHDTLLQSSQGLVLKVHAAARRLDAGNPDRTMLDAAVADADLTLAEGRDRIGELRQAGRTTARLRADLVAIGKKLAREGSTVFVQSVDEATRELHSDIADEVFSIGREALFNAFRHAQAPQVRLELADTRAGFALSVADDGRGIADGALAHAKAAGHWGIAGMRERAARIGGRIEFSSRAGGGTEVVLTIPPLAAYRRRGFWRART